MLEKQESLAPMGGGAPPGAPPDTLACLYCGTTETPLWRRGPEGAQTLCNACGLANSKGRRRQVARLSPRGRKTKVGAQPRSH